MGRVCGFCGGPGVTKEHLWPDWLRKIILESRSGGDGKKFAAEFERAGQTKRFTTVDLETRVGMPCGTCNHGWMNDLENLVKPFVAQMAFPGTITNIDVQRAVRLAQWFTKIAMVFEFLGEGRYFSDVERREFNETRAMPQNVWVWVGRYDGPRAVHGEERRGKGDGLAALSVYSLTVTLGFLVLQLLAHRESAGQFSTFAERTRPNALMQLFPPLPGKRG